MECVLQLFSSGQWSDAAVVDVPKPELGGVGGRATFEYDLAHAFGVNPEPVSLSLPLNTAIAMFKQWPAFLFDLIPQGAGRTFLLGELGLPDNAGSDFALLRAGAFNPIGRLRIREAVDYFAAHQARHATAQTGLPLEEVLTRGETFVERMLIHGMLAAGTTGVQGAAPKYLLTRGHDGLWHGDAALPDHQAAAHFIVKLPRGKADMDRKVLRNEAAYMRTAARMGLRVEGVALHRNDMLFIPRFDRQVGNGGVIRLHQESAASLAGIAGFDARPSQFTLLRAIRSVVTDPLTETLEYLCRDVLNLAMRNTDNHARNTAVQRLGNTVRLTPLYDFAPMYLDPGGIARTARWHHPRDGRELTVWGEVIVALALPETETVRLRAALAQFGVDLERLPDIMRECSVDDDVIDHLQRGVDEQSRQLKDLL